MALRIRRNKRSSRGKRLLVKIGYDIHDFDMESGSKKDWERGVESLVSSVDDSVVIRLSVEEILKHAQCFDGPPTVNNDEDGLLIYYKLKVPKDIPRVSLDSILGLTASALTKFFAKHGPDGKPKRGGTKNVTFDVVLR